ncbi:spike base protein, RCAP_Rcc01079 family [Fictibacillus phosphorivorans]|uniref:spike base protein, RCAP_Rcc01079 family n=1 Tax=Fictibacillus phosphorivorans TaxID=1221500 RepID=UPI0035E55233
MHVHGEVNIKTKAIAVTPNDATALTGGSTKGLYIGGAGNVAVTTAEGNNLTFNGLQVGVIHNLSVTHVKLTGTTATNIIALY